MNIVVLDGYAANPGDLSWEGFEALGALTVYDRTPDDPAEIIARIGDAGVILTNKTPIRRQVLEACPGLRYVGELATGYNNIDVEAARQLGVTVTNIPAYSTASVAQLTIALLLEICHRVGHHDAAVHAGRWQTSADFSFWDFPLIELAGKTFGIVGYGTIGRAVAPIARALGMEVLAHSRTPRGDENARAATFEEVLAKSDIVSLHCPLFPETQGMMNRETFAKMKDGAIFLNTSRGGLVDERDLADALNSGKLRAAGVDVVSREPISGDNPLLTAKNCIITPHFAWAAYEPRVRLMDIAADNLRAFLKGSPINMV